MPSILLARAAFVVVSQRSQSLHCYTAHLPVRLSCPFECSRICAPCRSSCEKGELPWKTTLRVSSPTFARNSTELPPATEEYSGQHPQLSRQSHTTLPPPHARTAVRPRPLPPMKALLQSTSDPSMHYGTITGQMERLAKMRVLQPAYEQQLPSTL